MENNDIIEKYLEYRRDKEKKAIESTLGTNRKALTVLSRTVNKPFKDITEEEMNGYLKQYKPSTYNNRLAILKPFYRWLFNLDKSDKLPDCIRRFNSVPTKQIQNELEANLQDRVITKSELAKLIDCARTPRDRAMFECLYYMGVRQGELLSMNTGDATYDGEFTRIRVRESKTKIRKVSQRGRLNELMTYVETYHKYRDTPNKPLWVNDEGKRLGKDGVLYTVKITAKKAGMTRNIKPHDFRHTSISNDRDGGMPLTHIETKHGLVHGSNMMRVYDHNKTKDYEEYLRRKENGDTEPTYELLQKQKETLEEKYSKEINKFEKELKKEITDLQTELKKKTEIDNFIMDSLGIIAGEMVHTKGIKAINELFRKHNVPLAGD